jgi:hypothetical protein
MYFRPAPDSRPVSIILTTLAARSYRNQPGIYEAFVEIVRDMPKFIELRSGRWWVANPVEPEENFADKWNESPDRRENFLRWIRKVQTDFSELGNRHTLNEAVDAMSPWIGGQIMAKAARDLGVAGYSPNASPSIQVPALADAGHCQSPQWPVRQKYGASVTASVHFRKNGKRLWGLSTRPTPKKVWLKFVITTDTPRPYDVRWQVVNTGREAREANALRGDYYEGDAPGTPIRWESTLYSGTHWVEAFVIKDGVCVARSGRQFVKIR